MNCKTYRLRQGLTWAACALVCASLAACFEPAKDTHPDQVLTKRRALFKQMNRAMEPIGLVANGRKEFKPEELLAQAQDLEKLSSKPWVYFTVDGNYPPTHATSAVWTQPEAFKKAQDQYMGTVQKLVQAAQGGKLEDVQRAVNDVTASCKACHREFRSE